MSCTDDELSEAQKEAYQRNNKAFDEQVGIKNKKVYVQYNLRKECRGLTKYFAFCVADQEAGVLGPIRRLNQPAGGRQRRHQDHRGHHPADDDLASRDADGRHPATGRRGGTAAAAANGRW